MEALTKTENEIAQLVALGYIKKEIADKKYVSEHTVHAHLRNIRKKLGARNIADITREYILSLEHPKLLFRAMLFLTLQLGIILGADDIDLRKPSQRTARVRTTRLKT